MPMTADFRVLLLPGWQNSGPEHWQSRWQALHGWQHVEQDDWQWPRRGDWMARLEETLLAPGATGRPPAPVLLVAHSLGCLLAAAWAGHSRCVERVAGALLVAPPDLDRDDAPPQLFNWRGRERRPLPFRSLVVYSEDDPYCSPDAARTMVADWGAGAVSIGRRGHINGASGLGDWPQGLAMLDALAAGRPAPAPEAA